ncbi:MAG: 30S ribosomal protein S6 [Candidatus Saccharibacteria bacterium]|nr:30S ribosomal protein S6 [Candidatus Saccharibacteria bacterium]
MKNYELTIVFHPDLEMNIDPALDKVKKILEANNAKIINEEVDGKKRLSYEIAKQQFGLYYYFDLELPAEAPAKISSAFNIADEILRYLLCKTDERKAKLAAKRAEQTARSNSAEETNNKEEA